MTGFLRVGRRWLNLVAPVLVPSWRFFDTIGPSPRLQYSPCNEIGEPQGPWTDVLVSRASRSTRDVLTELFFSPARNDALYLAACCDRVVEDGSRAAYDAIVARILVLARSTERAHDAGALRFRVLHVQREGTGLSQAVTFVSDVVHRNAPGGP